MTIIPKFAENDYKENMGLIKSLVHKDLELQMLSPNFSEGLEECKKVTNQLPELEYVVLHLPFNCVAFEFMQSNRELEHEYIEFLVGVIKYAAERHIRIDILAHLNYRPKYFKRAKCEEFLEFVVNLIEGTNVYLLFENETISLTMSDDEELPIESLSRTFENPRVHYCLDICHLQATENALGREIKLSSDCLRQIQNVHFSMTRNGEGYKNKAETHGKGHLTLEQCEADLKYLQEKGIDLSRVRFVTEIVETDYAHRPDMVKEIRMLVTLSDKY